MNSVLNNLSSDLADIVDNARERVVCVGAGKTTPRSGLVIGNGEIITVARAAEPGEPVPVLVGQNEVSANVAAFDPASGMALLTTGEVSAGTITDPGLPRVGSLSVTVAYPVPDGHEARLGMIRCVGGRTRAPGGRRLDAYFQTDSARFRGFAGSVVFSTEAEVLGMTMPVRRREEGFVIPTSQLLIIASQLREGDVVGTGYLGVQATPVDLPEEIQGYSAGLLITGIENGSPAEHAGLHVGTFIVGIGDHRTVDLESLYDALSGVRDGSELTIVVVVGGEVSEVPIAVRLRR
jgi:serine protease DegS